MCYDTSALDLIISGVVDNSTTIVNFYTSMQEKFIIRWLQSIDMPTNFQDYYDADIMGLLMERLTRQKAPLIASLTKQHQLQNYQIISDYFNFDLKIPSTMNDLFVLTVLQQIFNRFVVKILRLSENHILDFVHRVVNRMGQQCEFSNLDQVCEGLASTLFLPSLAAIKNPNFTLHDCYDQVNSADEALHNAQLALSTLSDYTTILLTSDELVQRESDEMLLLQLFTWSQQTTDAEIQRNLDYSHLKSSTLVRKFNVVLSHGMTAELVTFFVAGGAVVLQRNSAKVSKSTARKPVDILEFALQADRSEMNSVKITKDQILKLQLDGDKLLFTSKRSCFDDLVGVTQLVLGFADEDDAMDAAGEIAAVLQ